MNAKQIAILNISPLSFLCSTLRQLITKLKYISIIVACYKTTHNPSPSDPSDSSIKAKIQSRFRIVAGIMGTATLCMSTMFIFFVSFVKHAFFF